MFFLVTFEGKMKIMNIHYLFCRRRSVCGKSATSCLVCFLTDAAAMQVFWYFLALISIIILKVDPMSKK